MPFAIIGFQFSTKHKRGSHSNGSPLKTTYKILKLSYSLRTAKEILSSTFYTRRRVR